MPSLTRTEAEVGEASGRKQYAFKRDQNEYILLIYKAMIFHYMHFLLVSIQNLTAIKQFSVCQVSTAIDDVDSLVCLSLKTQKKSPWNAQ